MNQRQLLASALASAMALGLVQSACAHADSAKGKDKCFGVAKAGENTCANLSGSHSCAGQAATDKSPEEWALVAKGTCAKLGGLNTAQAKAALAAASSAKATDKR
ncbi:MAG: DUF2282 domain-containing protein [Pseudomonadota bacterium]